jgi:hypothetical protein
MQKASGMYLSRFTMELATALFTGVLGGVVCYGSFEFGTGWGDAGPEPGYFPFYVGALIIAASAVNLAMACARHRRDLAEEFLSAEQGRRILSFFGPMFLFVLICSWLGFYVAMILYLFGVMVFQGGYRLSRAAFVSLATAVLNYLLFEIWFQVPLLKGPLEAALGLR